jgi:hypothetical protein
MLGPARRRSHVRVVCAYRTAREYAWTGLSHRRDRRPLLFLDTDGLAGAASAERKAGDLIVNDAEAALVATVAPLRPLRRVGALCAVLQLTPVRLHARS